MLFCVQALLWLFWFFLGACLFSFAGVVACRLPKGEGALWGRSHCLSCGRILGPAELIPCLSYLLQRGRCRGCGGKIPVRDFGIELLGGLCACASMLRWGGERDRVWVTLLALLLLVTVALTDYDTKEIYDRFHVLLLLCGVAAIWAFPETELSARLIGCVVLSVPMLIVALFLPYSFGGGDIKLAFALGFLLGWRGIVCVMFLSFFAAGSLCIWRLARKQAGWKDQIAFGPFLCAGAAVALFYGNEVVDWWLGLAKY